MADPETTGWIAQAVTGLGLSSTAMGAWILRTSNRQARIEQKLDDMDKHHGSRMDKLEEGVGKIHKHLTGADLW